MARKTNINFAEGDDSQEDSVVIDNPVTVTASTDGLVKARVKGTWKMYWGHLSFNFEDGKSYKLPEDLFHYLRKNGNIYDTMS